LLNILIVEDENAINELICTNLSNEGYCCSRAYDGKEAADLIENNNYDLILLDIMLPKINGYEPLSREDTKNAAAYILDEGLRLEALSLKLMDLIVLNRQDFVLEELPADELLQNIVDTMQPLLVNASIKFRLEDKSLGCSGTV
jgi:CheY-like chemotaxis protein